MHGGGHELRLRTSLPQRPDPSSPEECQPCARDVQGPAGDGPREKGGRCTAVYRALSGPGLAGLARAGGGRAAGDRRVALARGHH